jgi:hypothetical protein
MNAQQLFKADGTPIPNGWYCGECGRIWNSQRDAEKLCCTTPTCADCGCDISKGHTRCYSCRLVFWFSQAEKVTKYAGMLYDPRTEEFYDGLDELEDAYSDDGKALPEWVFTCVSHEPRRIYASEIVETMAEGMYDDADDHFTGEAELDDALTKFWERNKKLLTYTPNFKQILIIKSEAGL